MKVSRHSWHYKLYRYFRNFYEDGPILPFRGSRSDYVPKSLCSYFWTTVLMVAAFPLFLVVVLPILLVAILIAMWIVIPLRDRRKAKREAAGKPTRGPSLIVSFVKAQKQKRCPLIELTD